MANQLNARIVRTKLRYLRSEGKGVCRNFKAPHSSSFSNAQLLLLYLQVAGLTVRQVGT